MPGPVSRFLVGLPCNTQGTRSTEQTVATQGVNGSAGSLSVLESCQIGWHGGHVNVHLETQGVKGSPQVLIDT